MNFLVTHIENEKSKDLPQAVNEQAIVDLLGKLLEEGLVVSVHIATLTDDEIIFVKD